MSVINTLNTVYIFHSHTGHRRNPRQTFMVPLCSAELQLKIIQFRSKWKTLTVSSTHASIVVWHRNQVIDTLAVRLRPYHKPTHVQTPKTNHHVFTICCNIVTNIVLVVHGSVTMTIESSTGARAQQITNLTLYLILTVIILLNSTQQWTFNYLVSPHVVRIQINSHKTMVMHC